MFLVLQRKIALIVGICIWCSGTIFAINKAPVISAGPDASYKSGNLIIYLEGDASDDSTSYDSLKVKWKQISGTSQVTILSDTTLTTRISAGVVGEYVFQLSVSDGKLTSYDTVAISITQSAPFALLAPVNNQQIEIGKPFTIKWQREPLIPCQVYYSIDAGKNWTEITVQGSSIGPTLVWDVDSTFIPNTQGIIKVTRYQIPGDFVTGSCIFVNHSPQGIKQHIQQNKTTRFVFLNKNGTLTCSGFATPITAIKIFNANGSLLAHFSGPLEKSRLNIQQRNTTTLIYQIFTKSTFFQSSFIIKL